MTPSQTKLMDQKKVLQDIIDGIGTMSMEYWTDSTASKAQAALDFLVAERSKAPTVEQVMEVVKGYRTGVKPQSLRAIWMCEIEHEDLRSRLTKLFGG